MPLTLRVCRVTRSLAFQTRCAPVTTTGTIFPYKLRKVRGMTPLVNHEGPSASKSHINCSQVLSSLTNQQKQLKGTGVLVKQIACKFSN